MSLRLEASRLLVYRFADLHAKGEDAAVAASMAKLQVSESFVQNSLDAVRLFGAAGYAEETGLERELRDSVGGVIFSGTNDIQRNIIAHSPAGVIFCPSCHSLCLRRPFRASRHAPTARKSPSANNGPRTVDDGPSTVLQGPGMGARGRHRRGAGADLLPGLTSGHSSRGIAVQTLFHRVALFGVLAVGAALVIISGGIDLSTGPWWRFVGRQRQAPDRMAASRGAAGGRCRRCRAIVAIVIGITLLMGLAIGLFHALDDQSDPAPAVHRHARHDGRPAQRGDRDLEEPDDHDHLRCVSGARQRFPR